MYIKEFLSVWIRGLKKRFRRSLSLSIALTIRSFCGRLFRANVSVSAKWLPNSCGYISTNDD